MSILIRLLGLLTGLVAIPAVAQQSAPADAERPIAIIGADVLPMTGPERLSDQTVLVSGDRITAVGPRSSITVPAGAQRIEAGGLVLMPGLVDMHIHLAPVPGQPGDAAHRALAVMLAHGVTTARTMAGSPANLAAREAVERGEIAGPRIYAAAPALHAGNTADAAAAREAVAAARRSGYDLIKSHHIVDPAVWQAVQDEAARQELATAGHVANPVGLDRALSARQQVEHLDGFIFELLPQEAPERAMEFAQIPPPSVVVAAAAASDERIEALARRVAAAGGYQVPTLALFERVTQHDQPTEALMAAPEMRYVPDAALRQWAEQREQFRTQSGYTLETAEAFQNLRRRIVRALHRADVPLMAGSDTAQAFHLWGPGLIAEIEALAAAGLTPMEALRSATVVPRDYLRSLPGNGSHRRWTADFGTVEPGARADLILLRGDPSRDLAALGRLETVIAAGRVHDRADLDRRLEEASRAAKGGPA